MKSTSVLLLLIGLNITAVLAAREACGGYRIADSDSVSYPGTNEVLRAGEVCVWAVHLNSTQGFRIDFSTFDIESTTDDCSDAGVRVYALSNLVPSDRIESYTFCKAQPPPELLFLSGSVGVIVSYSAPNVTISGSGFSLKWEGNLYNPLNTRHLASFTNEAYGSIRYPALGQYQNNLAVTWVIAPNEPTDFRMVRLGLQSCQNTDPCTCDAVLIYEIDTNGVLAETHRVCSSTEEVTYRSLQSTFVLAFFTDSQAQSLGGFGIDARYTPEGEIPTSTTTEIPGIRCGQVLRGESGTLRYKEGETYDANERCVWTLRHHDASSYHFRLISTGVNDTNDGIEISALKRYPSSGPITDNRVVRFPGDFEMKGNPVIITFFSDGSNQGQGFVLEWDAVLFIDDISNLSQDFIFSEAKETLKYPEDEVDYNMWELSTFLYAPEFNFGPDRRNKLTFEVIEVESCSYAHYYLYKFYGDDTFGEPRWDLEGRYCGTDTPMLQTFHDDIMLLTFTSEVAAGGKGFNITYEYSVTP